MPSPHRYLAATVAALWLWACSGAPQEAMQTPPVPEQAASSSTAPSPNPAQPEGPAPYTYDDRDVWLQLPHFDKDFDDESLTVHAVALPETPPAHRFLFIGETAVPNNGDALVMQHLAAQNPHSAIWYIDTPDAFFLPRERTGMRNNDGVFMEPILEHLSRSGVPFTLITMDVMAVPLLRGIRQWQSQAEPAQLEQLRHVILLYPSLYVNTPVAGHARELFPISRHSALPITVVQPQLGAQANVIEETVDALRQGGSLVALQRIDRATDGIYKFQDVREMALTCATLISRSEAAMQREAPAAQFTVRPLPAYDLSDRPTSTIVTGLTPWKDQPPVPNIELPDLQGREVNLRQDHAGKAVLLTFWATWCPHCVEEIPSMNRALKQLNPQRFAMVSVSYKDTPAIMRNFLRKTPMEFPVLMDRNGKVSERWKIYSFPSSFLIDRQGRIRYSINTGALWDSPEMLEKLREVSQ